MIFESILSVYHSPHTTVLVDDHTSSRVHHVSKCNSTVLCIYTQKGCPHTLDRAVHLCHRWIDVQLTHFANWPTSYRGAWKGHPSAVAEPIAREPLHLEGTVVNAVNCCDLEVPHQRNTMDKNVLPTTSMEHPGRSVQIMQIGVGHPEPQLPISVSGPRLCVRRRRTCQRPAVKVC